MVNKNGKLKLEEKILKLEILHTINDSNLMIKLYGHIIDYYNMLIENLEVKNDNPQDKVEEYSNKIDNLYDKINEEVDLILSLSKSIK